MMSMMRRVSVMRSCAIGLLVLVIAATGNSDISAVGLHPNLVQQMRADGTLEEYLRMMDAARARGVWSPPENPYRLMRSPDDPADTFEVVVLLVDFSDNEWTGGLAAGTEGFFDTLLFSEDALQYGSMTEFYLENSYGGFLLTGDIYGWYRMPETYAFYVDGQAGVGPYPNNAQRLAEDAVVAADPDVDFSLYDNDGNGWVEGLLIIHAGEGHETTANVNDIHSHQWTMANTQVLDGMFLRNYMMMPEENGNVPNDLATIGVFCHNFGHLVGGLPDLYDTDYSSHGIGNWSVMSGGSWNGNGECPAHFDAWCKEQLGFLVPVTITENQVDWEFPQVENSPSVVKLWKYGSPGLQYFLVENRQKTGFDTRLPGDGLLIYHVDNSVPDNNDEEHYKVALEQADGLLQLENGINSGDPGDPYPGLSNAREFGDITIPSSRDYAGIVTEVAVWNISDSDSMMTANLDIEFSRPMLTLTDYSFDDDVGGDGDGLLELGETIDFYFLTTNLWADAENVVAVLAALDPRLTFTVSEVAIGTVPGRGGTGDNYGLPLQFEIPSDMDSVMAEFYLTVTHGSYDDSVTYSFRRDIGGAKVLIVADDQGSRGEYDHYYTDAIDSLNTKHTGSITYGVWDKETLGTPGLEQAAHPVVVWFTGDHRESTLTAEDRQFIRDYLDSGGNLFLTGQDVAEHMSTDDPALLSDYFKCTYGGNGGDKWEAHGDPSSAIGVGGIKLVIRDSQDAAGNLVSPDYLVPLPGATVNFRYHVGDEDCGIEMSPGTYRAVLFGFGFEAINDYYARYFDEYESRETIMARILMFFDISLGYACGDVDWSEQVDIDDIVYLVEYIFGGGPPPIPLEAGDADCTGVVDIDDVVYLVTYVFLDGPAPCDPNGDMVPDC